MSDRGIMSLRSRCQPAISRRVCAGQSSRAATTAPADPRRATTAAESISGRHAGLRTARASTCGSSSVSSRRSVSGAQLGLAATLRRTSLSPSAADNLSSPTSQPRVRRDRGACGRVGATSETVQHRRRAVRVERRVLVPGTDRQTRSSAQPPRSSVLVGAPGPPRGPASGPAALRGDVSEGRTTPGTRRAAQTEGTHDERPRPLRPARRSAPLRRSPPRTARVG